MSIFEDLVHEEFQSTNKYSKFRDTALFLIDTVCTYLDLEHPAPAMPKVTSLGSLKCLQPAKTFPVYLPLKSILYVNLANPDKIFTFPNAFAQL